MKIQLKVIYVYLELAFHVYVLNRVRCNRLLRELKKLLKQYDMVLDSNIRKRINIYTMQACIINYWFTALRGKKASREEILRALYLGAITPLVDDFSEEKNVSYREIIHLIDSKSFNNIQTLLLIGFLRNKLFAKNESIYEESIIKALEAQDLSLLQVNENEIDEERLEFLTRQKGGTSMFMSRLVLKNEVLKDEKEAIFTLGFVLQLINDMFDIHKDNMKNHQTLFSKTKNIKEPISLFYDQHQTMFEQFERLGYLRQHIRKCLIGIVIVTSRGMVCAEQLLRLQKSEDEYLNLDKINRQDLVCDMEKIVNIKKSLWYTVHKVKSLV